MSPEPSASQTASATAAGVTIGNPAASSRSRTRAAEHRRVGDAGADRVDLDPATLERRRDAANEADDRVLRGRVDRIVRHRGEAGERGGRHDPAARGHHLREAPDPEDDAVDVDRHRPPVGLERDLGRIGLAAEHARVEAGDVDRPDRVPLGRRR